MRNALDYRPGPSEAERQAAACRRRAEWREAIIPLVIALLTVAVVLISFALAPRP